MSIIEPIANTCDTGGGSGEGGVTIHNLLSGRSASNAHPMSAITGLVTALASKLEADDLDAINAAVAALVAQTITNGVTTSAPSQDVVFDALALKADLSSFPNPQPSATVTPEVVGSDMTWDVNPNLGVDSVIFAGGAKLTYARLRTTAALPASTYSNGSFGVGATITGSVNGAAADIDFTTPGLGNRVVVSNQANPYENGIYELTQVGDGSNPFIWTRVPDADEAADFAAGLHVLIGSGISYGGSTAMVQTQNPTMGTSDIFWTAPRKGDSSPTDAVLGPNRAQRRYFTDFDEPFTTVTTLAATTAVGGATRSYIYAIAGSTGAQLSRSDSDGTADGVAVLTPGTTSTGIITHFWGLAGVVFDPDKRASFHARGARLSAASGGGDTFVTRYGFCDSILNPDLNTTFLGFEAGTSGNWFAVSRKPEAAQASQAWTRSGTVVTFTVTGHGMVTGDTITVSVSSSVAALPLLTYGVVVTGANTFTVQGLNAGAASGTATIARNIGELTDVGTAPGTTIRNMQMEYNPANGQAAFRFGTTLVATHTARVPAVATNTPFTISIVKKSGTTPVTCTTDLVGVRLADTRSVPPWAT